MTYLFEVLINFTTSPLNWGFLGMNKEIIKFIKSANLLDYQGSFIGQGATIEYWDDIVAVITPSNSLYAGFIDTQRGMSLDDFKRLWDFYLKATTDDSRTAIDGIAVYSLTSDNRMYLHNKWTRGMQRSQEQDLKRYAFQFRLSEKDLMSKYFTISGKRFNE